jgi:putative endonuclease
MTRTWKWYVYVIECSDGLYYTGMTWNIEQRLEQHRLGQGSKFTARHGFKALVYVEEFDDIYEARMREVQVKDFSRKKKELLFERREYGVEVSSSQPLASNNKVGRSAKDN